MNNVIIFIAGILLGISSGFVTCAIIISLIDKLLEVFYHDNK